MSNILVVDDSPTMRRMVIASLRDLNGVVFDEASSGLEAIEHLALSPVNLMILDLNMPDMHGLEVVRFVRKHNAVSRHPYHRANDAEVTKPAARMRSPSAHPFI